jgi:ATP-binding cassette subfamily B protein RaxB
MTLGQMASTASELGLDTQCVEFDQAAIGRLPVPCILHWNNDHFVVLVEAGNTHAVIHDPGAGRQRLSLKEVASQATGAAVLLRPSSAFGSGHSAVSERLSFRTVTGGFRGLAGPLARVLGLALALELVGVLTPLAGQVFVDHAIPSGDKHLLLHATAAFGFIFLSLALLTALRSWSLIVLGSSISLSWSSNVLSHLMRLRLSFFSNRSLGDILSRFDATNAIQFTLTNRFIETLLDGSMAVFTAIVLVLYSVKLALLTFAFFCLYACMRAVLFRPLEQANVLFLNANATVQSVLLESIRGMQTIRLNDAAERRVQKFVTVATLSRERKLVLERLNVAFTTCAGTIQGVHGMLILALGAWTVINGNLTVGALLAYTLYSGQFTVRATKLLDYAVELRMLGLQADRLADIVATEPEPDARAPDSEPTDASVEFRNVSFRYHSTDRFILDNCSLRIEAGDVVAITGASGCGKTTLAKLLLGLVEPEQGQILIGGVPIEYLGKTRLRRQIACVLQDDQVFAGSIAENIHFFSDTPDDDLVLRSAVLAEIDKDIRAFWMGYRTALGDMGMSLSAGQRQRLLIARALYRKPEILVLDEATSHLDVENERLVSASLRRMGMTRIVIAHRPETIATATRVLVLDDRGKLNEWNVRSGGEVDREPTPARQSMVPREKVPGDDERYANS